MTNLAKHPLLMDCYNVCQAIEACGASPELTNAVSKASDLMRGIEALVDRHRTPPDGCVLQAVDTGDGWCLEVANPATEECVALLAWPESWPETVTAKQVAEFGFEIC